MNKKRTWKTFGLLAVLSCLLLMGCGERKQATDYSKYGFTDITWVRQTEADTEYLTFGSDGSYSYYCACGEPVNDSDLCEGYTYDDLTKTIDLNCSDTTEDMVTTIGVISCDEQQIELDFDGEIRIFTREELAIKLHVVRQTISKWEQGLSVPDSDMLIAISEALETPVSTLLGETVQESQADDLRAISEKLEIINLQLAQRKATRRKIIHWLLSWE